MNAVELEDSLKKVWWGNHNIKVNKAIFDREEKSEPAQFVWRFERAEGKRVEAGTSYQQVLVGDRHGDIQVADIPTIEVLPAEELLLELESCLVGRLKLHLEPDALQTCLFMEGRRGIKVVPMGEKMVLLKEERKGELAAARESKRAWWSATFTEVVPWSPNLVAATRRTWVQLRGIPLHIWNEESFKTVGALFGSFIDFDDDTVSRRRLDVANIPISTKNIEIIEHT